MKRRKLSCSRSSAACGSCVRRCDELRSRSAPAGVPREARTALRVPRRTCREELARARGAPGRVRVVPPDPRSVRGGGLTAPRRPAVRAGRRRARSHRRGRSPRRRCVRRRRARRLGRRGGSARDRRRRVRRGARDVGGARRSDHEHRLAGDRLSVPPGKRESGGDAGRRRACTRCRPLPTRRPSRSFADADELAGGCSAADVNRSRVDTGRDAPEPPGDASRDDAGGRSLRATRRGRAARDEAEAPEQRHRPGWL
jgi:hypothetical protein